MASVIYLNSKECGRLTDSLHRNVSPNEPYDNWCGDTAIIAKGNIIEGVEAKY